MYHTVFVCCLLLLSQDLSFSDKENIVPQSAFKLNNALATAEPWHLSDHMLKVISTGNQ
jgi:hypothetical protein